MYRMIFGDSRKMELPSSSVHLIVTSPPYPMIKMWDRVFSQMDPKVGKLLTGADSDVRQAYGLMHKALGEVWCEACRLLVDGGIMCVNVGDATRSFNGEFRLFTNHARVTEVCERLGFVSLPFILWKKPTNKPNAFLGSGFLPPNAYVTMDHEFILIFRKGGKRKFSEEGKASRRESTYTKKERDEWFSQTWTMRGVRQKLDGANRRTAAFPEEIAARLIRMFSCVGETVLDPFAGTGTTLKAADRLGRNPIGYEIDESLKKLLTA